MLARHGRRLLNLLDDAPVVPGDTRPAFENGSQARQILNDAEEDLRDWSPNLEPISSSSGQTTSKLLPAQASTASASETGELPSSVTDALDTPTKRDISGSSTTAQAAI